MVLRPQWQMVATALLLRSNLTPVALPELCAIEHHNRISSSTPTVVAARHLVPGKAS